MNPLAPPLVLPLVAADASLTAIVGWEAIDEWATANVESWRATADEFGQAERSLDQRACYLAVRMLGEFLSAKVEVERYHRTFGPFLVDLPPGETGTIGSDG